MSREWLLLEHDLHLGTETVETTAHIRHTGGDPDLRSCGKLRITCSGSQESDRTSTGSAPLSTLIIARPGSSM